MATDEPKVKERLQSEKMKVVNLSVQPGSSDDAVQTVKLARETATLWVVVDGYHFGADYQQILKQGELWLLYIDDNGYGDYSWADIVLNQNLHAHERLYTNRKPSTRLLLGTDYTLLRREFLKWRGWKREFPETARRVLVTLGGSDPDNVTLRVIQALCQLDMERMEVVVVAGASNSHRKELQTSVRGMCPAIRLEDSVMDMPELMAWADIAVSAGGSTCWELAFMGLPNVILVLAENQLKVARELDSHGVSLNLGSHASLNERDVVTALSELITDAARRQELSERGRHLIDGYGASRVVAMVKGAAV
jgi:UDP-2,4-diacetamido-2,4,6-trideoxy-beta-L-altropyranose hydrolase